MTIDREELAWAAGFFDGEGTVGFSPMKEGNSYRRRIYLSLPQKTRTLLLRFRRAVGSLGHSRRRDRTCWYYRTDRFEAIQAVVAMLWFKLGPTKRAQATKALRAYRAYA